LHCRGNSTNRGLFRDGREGIADADCRRSHRAERKNPGTAASLLRPVVLGLLLPLSCLSSNGLAAASGKEKISYGEGLIVNLPVAEAEVEQVVEDVAQNGVIRGTKEYNKDEFVSGAKASSSSNVFPQWSEGGKVFYKVRMQAIDPRNFKDSGDVGTLVVRYVVLPQGEGNTVLRIDALFEEDFRHVQHQSNGSVESSEYKDIREHLDAIELMKRQNIEAEQERQERIAKKRLAAQNTGSGEMLSTPAETTPAESSSQPVETGDSSSRVVEVAPTPAEATPPAQTAVPPTLEEKVKGLRKQVERLVKAPGAPLKSAPFHTASTLQLLTPGTEVVILINTPYWYGVETHEGQHGWMLRDELEQP
jgi:hypothetical protein